MSADAKPTLSEIDDMLIKAWGDHKIQPEYLSELYAFGPLTI
jgi:hypothetical protein